MVLSKFVIEGGYPLSGEMKVQGAKNSVLPLLAASLLVEGETVLHNCPHISDVETALAILRHLGCRTQWQGHTIVVDAQSLNCQCIPDELMRQMRSSVMFLGPMLARCGQLDMVYPGGCSLGARPIDLHLNAIREMGVQVEETGGHIHCHSAQLQGRDLYLPFPSVGATENIMLLASACPGKTRIINAAREPEIADLQGFLNALGMKVTGAGDSVVMLEGNVRQKSVEFTVMPDRIAAQTFLAAAAITGGSIRVRDANPMDMMAGLKTLEKSGCTLELEERAITLRAPERLRSVPPIKTQPHPGFATDAQAIFMSMLTVARGTSVVVENVFESRFGHAEGLRRMGADLNVLGRICVVNGVEQLHGAQVCAGDLRAGAALTVAALAARGQSEVSGLCHMDRGYEQLEETLGTLGARIQRIEE